MSWGQKTVSPSPSTAPKNRHRRPSPSWFGSQGEVLWLAGPAKRIGTQNSSLTRQEPSLTLCLKYPPGRCLCCCTVPPGFPWLLCPAWKSITCWKLWVEGPTGGASMAAGAHFNTRAGVNPRWIAGEHFQIWRRPVSSDNLWVRVRGSQCACAHPLPPRGRTFSGNAEALDINHSVSNQSSPRVPSPRAATC